VTDPVRPLVCLIIPTVRLVRLDAQNWSIETMYIGQSGKSKGKEVWKNCGYYGGIACAARSLLNNHVDLLIGTPVAFEDVRALITAVQESQQIVARALRGSGRRLAKKARNGDTDGTPSEST